MGQGKGKGGKGGKGKFFGSFWRGLLGFWGCVWSLGRVR